MEKELLIYAAELVKLRAEKDKLEDELDCIKEFIEKIQPKMVELMENDSITKFSVEGKGTFYIQSEACPTVTDKDVLFASLRSMDAGSLIQETVNNKTLKAFIKEKLNSDGIVPEGVELFMKTSVRVRKT